MKDLDYWQLSDFLNVFEAAALIVGCSPSYLDTDNPELLRLPSPEFDEDQSTKLNQKMHAVITALKSAIKTGRIKANLQQQSGYTYDDFDEDMLPDSVNTILSDDWRETRINVNDIRRWLSGKGINTGFFFPTNNKSQPGYLDKTNPHYAPKLEAAIRAWEAVTTDERYSNNGKTVKQNLENWLESHATEYGLIKKDGEINTLAIEEQIAKVANWNDGGGAPKTPG